MKTKNLRKLVGLGLGASLLVSMSFTAFATTPQAKVSDEHCDNISTRMTTSCMNCGKVTKAGVYRNKYNYEICSFGTGNHKEKLTRFTCGSCGAYADYWVPDCGMCAMRDAF